MIDYIPQIIYFLYLFEMLKDISFIFLIVLIASLSFYYIFEVIAYMENEKNPLRQLGKKMFVIFWIVLCIYVIIPSSNYMYLILAGTGIENVLKNEDVKRIVPKSIMVLEKYLDEKLNEKNSLTKKEK